MSLSVCRTSVCEQGVSKSSSMFALYLEIGMRKLKVLYLFLSLIAEITVHFQRGPRCGELAGTEHPH